MEDVTFVRQYAKALFGLCPDEALANRVATELEDAVRRIEAAPEVHGFLYHPEIPLDRKQVVLASLLPADLARPTQGLLNLLVRNRCLRMLPDVLRVFLVLRRESYGVLKAEVEAVRPLSEATRWRLKATLHKFTGHEVEIEEKLNSDLVGGVRIRVGDRIIDGSVAGRLRQMQNELLRATGDPIRAPI